MAKSKPCKEWDSMETRTVNASDTQGQDQKYDPALVSLFDQSSGAVRIAARPNFRVESHLTITSATEAGKSLSVLDSEGISLLSEAPSKDVQTGLSAIRDYKSTFHGNITAKGSSRKRNRKDADDDLESRYMSQLAKEEIKDDRKRAPTPKNKRQKTESQEIPYADSGSPSEDGEFSSDPDIVSSDEDKSAVENFPQHESLVTSREDMDLEKSSRTVFLANVSTMAIKSKKAKKILLDHLTSFTSSLPTRDGGHHIDSLRFRSTAFVASGIPKKAAFVRKEIMDSTTQSTNAYVVYTTQLAAREAATRLNGSTVLDRHLRVDSVAHPAKIDHRRCVFVGNLGFVDDETNVKAAEDDQKNKRPRKTKEPADVEEGLWRQFEKAGTVESVRVVRDKTTRVGKGFAYVQFKDANSVEKALLNHEKKFPPMLPRILRVTRAKNTRTVDNRKEKLLTRNAGSTNYRPKIPSRVQSLTGRAHKLFGRAGAAKLKATEGQHGYSSKSASGVAKSSDSIVFEGFRASSSQRKGVLKTARRKHGKPSNRSKDFKAKGRQKAKP